MILDLMHALELFWITGDKISYTFAHMSLLTVAGLSKKVNGKFIVKNISFQQNNNQRIALAGETGSGKSTLLKMIAGLVQPDGGSVVFNNERIKGPEEVLVPGTLSIAYLSQLFELPKFLRVEQVLEYANSLSEKQAKKLFKLCRIQHLLKRKTDELSGGERQRIALARQLLMQPRLLLLDEPYSNLDNLHKTILKDVLNDLLEQMKLTCILVSHDPLDTLSWANEMLVMHKGKIVQRGTPWEVYTKPVNEYVAGLFGKYTVLQPLQVKKLTGKSSKKNGILRPEQLMLLKKRTDKKVIQGVIKKSLYYGAYCDLTVEVNKQVVLVRTADLSYSAGQQVFIKMAQE